MHRREFLASVAVGSIAAAAHGDRPKIKVGQIGTGHAHASKLSAYRASPEYEVVGVVEADPASRKAAEASAVYRGLPFVSREQLLGTPGLQAVLIETRVRDLLDNAEAAVAAGKHVHIDKPPGDSLPRLKKLFDEAGRQKLMIQMGYMYRYNPAVVLLRGLLANGALGEVFEVSTVMSKVVPAGERARLAEYPGGMMFELGCHVIDLVVGVLGKPTAVVAYPLQSAPMPADKLKDNMLAVFTYPTATATVRSTALEVDGVSRRHMTVCGTGGTVHIQPLDNPVMRLTLARPHGDYKQGTQEIKFPKYVRYVDDAADMAAVIRGERPFAFTPEHDLATQEALLRACALSVD